MKTWKIDTALSPALVAEASGVELPSDGGFDGGFFTTISSDGIKPNTTIIWAVARPGNDGHLRLFAYNGTTVGNSLRLLWSGEAGDWPDTGTPSNGFQPGMPLTISGNPNMVPTVANGMVYVTGYRTVPFVSNLGSGRLRYQSSLSVFGLIPGSLDKPFPETASRAGSEASYWGVVKA